MNPAPVALFVYRRPAHLRRTLEALARNRGASESRLVIFSDGARPGDEEDVAEVRRICAGVSGFAASELRCSGQNRGLSASVISGVTEMLNESGRVIVLEDDMETAPGFLSFMNKALERFASMPEIGAVHAFLPDPPGELSRTCLFPGADCWGWGTWQDRWKLFNPDGSELLAELRRRKLERQFDFDNSFPFTAMLADAASGKIESWAIRWKASLFLAGKHMLQSRLPLVRNIGLDGSASHTPSPAERRMPEQRLALEDADIPVCPETASPEDYAAMKRAWRSRRPGFWTRVKGKMIYEFRKRFKQ